MFSFVYNRSGMFDALSKYKNNGHFFFEPTDALDEECIAPADQDGIYIIYELKKGRPRMVYIGSSRGGLKDSIKNGAPGEPEPRKRSLPVKMLSENIDVLDIYWYITNNGNVNDHPEEIKNQFLSMYREVYGELPKWNKHWQ